MTDESNLNPGVGEAAAEGEEFLTLDETVQFLGTSKATLYRWLGQGDLRGMKVGRQWRFRKADLIAYMQRSPAAAAVAPSEAMEAELEFFAEQLRRAEAADAVEFEEESAAGRSGDGETTRSEGRIALLAGRLLALAAAKGVSDIHLEPARQGSVTDALLRLRLDGVLHEIHRLPIRIHEALLLRFKLMAEMNLAERKVPQDGRFRFWYDGGEFEVRASILPTILGEAITMRLLDRNSVRMGLERLGLTEEDRTRLQTLVQQPQGLLLVTGPTGSGKSTLIYSCLSALANANRKTVTIEDPVEVSLPYTTQAQVNRKAGFTFAVGLRVGLRQDPDILLLGEMRDPESAELLLRAATTGHFGFSALHAVDAPATLIRLREMGVEPFLIAQAVTGIVALRLARKVCPHCKAPADPALPGSDFGKLQQAAAIGGYTLPPDATFYRGGGCEQCFLTGYQGRIGVFELLTMTQEIRQAFLNGATAEELTPIAVAHGMRTLVADGLRKAAEGLTTPEEVRRVTWG